ncbi:MAG: imm11 family protein [Phycisphaeraceae bacterium]
MLQPLLSDGKPVQHVSSDEAYDFNKYLDWVDSTTIGLGQVPADAYVDRVPSLAKDWIKSPLAVRNIKSSNLDHLYWPPQAHAYSEKAIHALSWCFDKEGEVVNLPCKGREDLYFFHLRTIADVLDTELSNLHWVGIFASPIYEYVFRFPIDWDHHIFYLQQDMVTHYVTDKFKKCVEENNLTGFVFKKVWSRQSHCHQASL